MRRHVAPSARERRGLPGPIGDLVVRMNRRRAGNAKLNAIPPLVEGPCHSTIGPELVRLSAAAIGVEDEETVDRIHPAEHHRSSLRGTIQTDRRNHREMPLVLPVPDGPGELIPGLRQLFFECAGRLIPGVISHDRIISEFGHARRTIGIPSVRIHSSAPPSIERSFESTWSVFPKPRDLGPTAAVLRPAVASPPPEIRR
jgi:hypothetical protein